MRVGASLGNPASIDASLGKPDFFVPFITVDELSSAHRQDVMATAFALRNLTLETQSRGKLDAHARMAEPHGIFYAAHSRVKNVASADVNTYVANYVAKGQSESEQRRNATGTPTALASARLPVGRRLDGHLAM